MIKPFTEKYMDKIGIAPNMRRLVNLLRANGFATSDSGDGSGMGFPPELSNPFPHVFCDAGKNVVEEADRLLALMRGRGVKFAPQTEAGDEPAVEVEYDPLTGTGHLMLINLTDDDVWPA